MSKMWKIVNQLVSINNPWLTVIGESVLDENNQLLTYWRVDRPDSLIILPFYREFLLLPKPYYRHGMQKMTYDFPGGRCDHAISHEENARKILARELNLRREDIGSISPLMAQPWHVDSSFSNQHLFVYEARIRSDYEVRQDLMDAFVDINVCGIADILSRLQCLQCRCALLEWFWQNSKNA